MNSATPQAGRKMTIGTICIFLAEALILPTGLITAIFLTRRLGPVYYGVFALVSRLVFWIEWTGTTAFSGTAIKFISQEDDWRPVGAAIIKLYLVIGTALGLLIFFSADILSHIFREPSLAGHLKLYAVDVPLFCLACANTNILLGLGFFKTRALISSGRFMARLILIILLVEMGLSVRGAILGSIGASLVELLISGWLTRRALWPGSRFSLRPLVTFAAPLFMSGLSQQILRLDLFALKILGGSAAQAGYYGAAQNLSIAPAIFTGSLSGPLLTTLSRLLSQNEEAKARDIAMTALRVAFWFFPFAAMTAGAAPEITNLIFGPDFLPASPLLAILIFSALGMMLLNISRVILIALGRPGLTFALLGPLVPLAVTGHLLFIPRFMGTGAALTTTSVIFLGALISFITVSAAWKLPPPLKTILRSAVCSGAAFILAWWWPASGLALLVKLVVISGCILFIFFLSGEFSSRDLAFARSLLHWRTPDLE